MIPKSKLKGKWVSYHDRGQREGQVVKVIGKILTVKNALGEKKRIHPDKFRIVGVYFRKKLEMIDWTQ